MNIVKWLLGHPLAAIWALGAIAILLAMGPGNKKQHNAVAQTNEVSSEETVAVEDIAIKSSSHKVSVANTMPAVNEVLNVKEQTVANPKAPHTALNLDETANNNTVPFVSTTKNEESSENETIEKVAEDLGQLETDELLLMAREAYWNNGLDEAAQIYQQLIKREPLLIEHKGELGNVYWRQGYPKKAAELYSEIAIPLIESGSSDRVTNMVGFIQLFYPDRVEVIMDRLERSKNNK